MPQKTEPRRWPCGLDDSDKEKVKRRPIRCTLKECRSCGFNPAERDRRLRTGHFMAHTVTHSLHDDMGETVETIMKEVRTLRFAKAGA